MGSQEAAKKRITGAKAVKFKKCGAARLRMYGRDDGKHVKAIGDALYPIPKQFDKYHECSLSEVLDTVRLRCLGWRHEFTRIELKREYENSLYELNGVFTPHVESMVYVDTDAKTLQDWHELVLESILLLNLPNFGKVYTDALVQLFRQYRCWNTKAANEPTLIGLAKTPYRDVALIASELYVAPFGKLCALLDALDTLGVDYAR